MPGRIDCYWDYIGRLVDAIVEGLEDQLDAARQIIAVARRAAKGNESSGKVESDASPAPLPASLANS